MFSFARKPPPLVYIGPDTPLVRSGLSNVLTANGISVYTPSLVSDPNASTASVGSFRCALFHLDPAEGKPDPLDAAELLRVYQPGLPLAFLYETSGEAMLLRARELGPHFLVPTELLGAFEWTRDQAFRNA